MTSQDSSSPGDTLQSDTQGQGKTVSIVVPVFNRLAYTRRCLDAVKQHSGDPPPELIVVDNGSSDGTDAYLKQCVDSVVTLTQEENRGFACACNQGAHAAAGDYLLFLNNDTRVEPNWLAPLTGTLADASVGTVGSRLVYPDGGIQHAGVIMVQRRDEGRLFFDHVFRHVDGQSSCVRVPCEFQAVTGACLLVRREEFLALGGFDEAYWNGVEDIDFCLRVREAGQHVVYQPASLVVHDESQSGPERFSGTDQNNQRFAQKWRRKLVADFIVDEGDVTAGSAGVVQAYGSADNAVQEAIRTFARDAYL
jgi:GT2 family glycosyltransferase